MHSSFDRATLLLKAVAAINLAGLLIIYPVSLRTQGSKLAHIKHSLGHSRHIPINISTTEYQTQDTMPSITNTLLLTTATLLVTSINGFTLNQQPSRQSFALFSTTNEQSKDEVQPYVIARGDGSTGGRGLPMPKQLVEDEEQDGLRRPKVGAEMPNGRPSWFRVPAPSQSEKSRYAQVKESLKELELHTVCEEAQCPNIGECWNGGTGTIMLLGDTCTRGCMFCAVNTSQAPSPPDPFEPFKVSLVSHVCCVYCRYLYARERHSNSSILTYYSLDC